MVVVLTDLFEGFQFEVFILIGGEFGVAELRVVGLCGAETLSGAAGGIGRAFEIFLRVEVEGGDLDGCN